jgi:hypothetical protein
MTSFGAMNTGAVNAKDIDEAPCVYGLATVRLDMVNVGTEIAGAEAVNGVATMSAPFVSSAAKFRPARFAACGLTAVVMPVLILMVHATFADNFAVATTSLSWAVLLAEF